MSKVRVQIAWRRRPQCEHAAHNVGEAWLTHAKRGAHELQRLRQRGRDRDDKFVARVEEVEDANFLLRSVLGAEDVAKDRVLLRPSDASQVIVRQQELDLIERRHRCVGRWDLGKKERPEALQVGRGG